MTTNNLDALTPQIYKAIVEQLIYENPSRIKTEADAIVAMRSMERHVMYNLWLRSNDIGLDAGQINEVWEIIRAAT